MDEAGRARMEARLLREIGASGQDVRSLRERLGLDSGYVSRLLRSLEADALVTVEPLPEDRRTRTVRLLSASTVTLDAVDPDHPDAQRCLHAYFAELQESFDTGFDPARSLLPDAGGLRPPHGVFLVARTHGEPIGCAGLKLPPGSPAEIKRMWVAPHARGLGLARRFLSELEARAARHGHDVLRLDTNKALAAAVGLYRSHGFREVPAFNDEPYAHHWFEKRIDAPPSR